MNPPKLPEAETAPQNFETSTESTPPQLPATLLPLAADESSPVLTHQDLAPAPNNHGLSGVEGWLLFLCIWLTVIAPLFSYASLSANATSGFQWFWGVALILFTIVTGILLWTGRWIGWRVANDYYWTILGLAWLAVLMNNSPEQIGRAIATSIQSCIWLIYLNTSKRVQNTYLSQRPSLRSPHPPL